MYAHTHTYAHTQEREKNCGGEKGKNIDEKVKQNNEYNQMYPNRWVSMDKV